MIHASASATETINRWIEARWPDGVRCPRCNAENPYDVAKFKGRRWRCRECKKDFYLNSGTAFRWPKHNFEWYENIILRLVEGNSIYAIAGSSLAMNTGTFTAAHAILAALPAGEPCGHHMQPILTPRPIIKISACAECGKMAMWRNKEWTAIQAYIPMPVKDEVLFEKVLALCLRPQHE